MELPDDNYLQYIAVPLSRYILGPQHPKYV